MGFSVGEPNLDGASTVGGKLNIHMLDAFRKIIARIKLLEDHTGLTAVTPGKGQSAAPPKAAGIQVLPAAGTGRFQVLITNPQFASPSELGNRQQTALYHQLSYSTDPNFRSNVVDVPPGPDTHRHVFGSPGQTMYFKLRSTVDGHTFNQPFVTRGYKA